MTTCGLNQSAAEGKGNFSPKEILNQVCSFYKCILKKSNDSQSSLSMGAEGFVCSWEILLLNSPFLVPKIPSPLQKKTGGTQDGTTTASLCVAPSL